MGFTNPIHIVILLLIVLLVFGAKRLPELGRSLGSGIKEFKGSLEGAHDELAPEITATRPAAEEPHEHTEHVGTGHAGPAVGEPRPG